MAVEIEGLEFQIETTSAEAEKGIDRLTNSLLKLKTALKGDAGLSKVAKQLEVISNAKLNLSAVDKVEALSKSLTSLGAVKIPSTIAKRLIDIGTSLDGLNQSGIEKAEALSNTLQGMQSVQLPNLRNLNQTGNNMLPASVGTTTAATSGITQYTSQVVSATTQTYRLTDVLRGVSGVFSKAFSATGSVALNAFKVTLKGVSAAAKSAVTACKTLSSMLGSKLIGKVKSITSGMGQFLSSIKRIALYRGIRFMLAQLTASFKEGIRNLYMYSSLMGGTFKSSMDGLATSFQYLKNSMGAMVAPLINVIAPAVDMLIDKFAVLLNIVNQFFARLSGATSFTRAKKAAASYGDSISGAGKSAKKAAKDIKDATVGIDELNIISKNNSDSEGSGAGGKSYGDMFETVPIDSNVSEFTDKLKTAFNAGNWKSLGTLLGEKFNEIVDSIDWSGVGHKIGYGLNGAIQTAYHFLKAADFKKLGNRVAKLLNGAMEEIDFTYLGRSLVRSFTLVIDFIIGGLEGLDWRLVGKSIGDSLKGAFNEAQEWIVSYNWNQLGTSLWTNLKNCILGIDFAGVAASFYKALGSALAAAVSFIAGYVSSIWKDITGYFSKYLTNDNGTKKCGLNWVAGLLEGIKEGLQNIGKWIVDNVFTPFIEGFKECFGIHSPSTVMKEMGGYVVEGFLQGLNKFNEIASTVKEWAGKVVEWFAKGEDGKGIVERFKEIGGSIVSGFKDKVGSTYITVKTNVTTWASKTKEWFTSSSYGGVNSTNFQTFANNIVTGFKDKIGSAYVNTKGNMTTWAAHVKSWFRSIASYSAFSGFATDVVNGFKNRITGYYFTAQSSMNRFGSNVKTWFTDHCSYNSFYNVASDVIKGFKDGIGALYHTCKSTITSWAESIVSWFEDKLDVNSPSKVFYEIGGFAVAGFNNAITQVGQSTKSVVGTWADSFTNFTPAMALAVDTSSLKYYDSATFSRSISTDVQSRTEIASSSGFREAMEEFYHEYMEPTMVQMADDMRRQADKDEKTVVQVGNRVVTDAITTQKKANGYSFTG